MSCTTEPQDISCLTFWTILGQNRLLVELQCLFCVCSVCSTDSVDVDQATGDVSILLQGKQRKKHYFYVKPLVPKFKDAWSDFSEWTFLFK